jgi:hypothetical protein
MHQSEIYSTPAISTDEAPIRVTTTLYDVMAALQSVVEPEEDAVVVAIVAAWLRSGRLRLPEDATIAA